MFSSTFDLKVERNRASVAKRLDFSLNFSTTHISATVYHLKIFTITNICPPNETLLRMFSLDFLDKVAKRVDFRSTSSFARFFRQKSNFTQHQSIPLDSLNKVAKRLAFPLHFLSCKNRVKNRVAWPGPKSKP